MLFLYIAAACAGAYVLFIVVPGVISFFGLFGRKKERTLDDLFEGKPRCREHRDEMEDAMRTVEDAVREKGREVSVVSFDGAVLKGTFVDMGSDVTAVLYHGFHASWKTCFQVNARDFIEKGYNLLIPVQRAHGESGGRRCTLGLYEADDLAAWCRELKNKRGGCAFVYGISMGAYAASCAAPDLDPGFVRAIVADCGFESPYSQVGLDCKRRRLPAPLLMPVVRLMAKIVLGRDMKTGSGERLAGSRIPLMILHGEDDETVPFSDGKKIYEAAADPKEFIGVPGAVHTMAYVTGGEKVRRAVGSFISRYVHKTLKDTKISE